jgi:3-oxoacyl-[acyl-carrier-protein] synthase-1
MQGAYIRGMGVSCALGVDTQSCVSALQRMQLGPVSLQLDGLGEPLRMAYYRIPDGAELFDSGRCMRLLPAVAQAAVAEARLTAQEIRGLPLFIGSSCFSIGQSETGYAAALAEQPKTALAMPLCGYQDLARILQQALACEGDSYTYNTACTSSANALLGALSMLELGWCRQALVVGAELANRTTLAGFAGLQILAESVQPFAAARSGLVLGEGVSAVVLSAERGAPDDLCILGGASNCDTHGVTAANPDGNSVAAVLRQVLAETGLKSDEVRGIRAHGTGTPASDTAEALGLRQVFPRLPPLSVLKPYVGHTLGACGINELVLFAGALQRGFLPALPAAETPDLAFDVQPLRRVQAAPAGAYLLDHFGFGGNNSVLVLEKSAA